MKLKVVLKFAILVEIPVLISVRDTAVFEIPQKPYIENAPLREKIREKWIILFSLAIAIVRITAKKSSRSPLVVLNINSTW